MKLGNKNFDNVTLAIWLLRLGLAFVFVYAAVSSFRHPLEWVGYLPSLVTNHVAATTALKGFSVVELALAAWLVVGICGRYAALLAMLMFAGIVAFNPSQLIITFRDVGLAAAALALALLT
jgi:hypothetical protein